MATKWDKMSIHCVSLKQTQSLRFIELCKEAWIYMRFLLKTERFFFEKINIVFKLLYEQLLIENHVRQDEARICKFCSHKK